jgi:glycosyltransferase involved in cell wall biosynthesis
LRIIDRLIYGGPTRNVVFLTEGLAARGFETTLISGVPAAGESDMTFWANAYGVRPVVIQEMSRELGPRDVVVIWKLFWTFVKLQPDIIHTHKSKAGATGRVAAFLYKWCSSSIFKLQPRKVRILHTFHGHIFHSYYGKVKSSLFVFIERALATITDCVVTVSEQQRNEIRDEFRVGKSRTFCVVPLGVDFRSDPAHSLFREEHQIAEEDFLIAAVGRLCEVKNFSLMIRAFALARRENPDIHARLVVAGDGHLRRALEECARDLGVEELVTFTGFKSDIEALYPEVDVAALSSLNEGTPLSLIEAMGHGRPVLTTEVGGYRDILGDVVRVLEGFTIWEHGISVRSGDAVSYANALIFMAQNPVLRRQMGEKARAHVHRSHARERLVSDMATLYNNLWDGAPISPNLAVPENMKTVGDRAS